MLIGSEKLMVNLPISRSTRLMFKAIGGKVSGVGEAVGEIDGENVGDTVGDVDGELVGDIDGELLGDCEGDMLGE